MKFLVNRLALRRFFHFIENLVKMPLPPKTKVALKAGVYSPGVYRPLVDLYSYKLYVLLWEDYIKGCYCWCLNITKNKFLKLVKV